MTPRQLASYPWVLPQPGAPIRTVIDGIFATAGIPAPVPLVESTSIRLNYELMRSSDMIGVMPDDAAAAYNASARSRSCRSTFGDRLPWVGVMTRTAPPSQALTLVPAGAARKLVDSCAQLRRYSAAASPACSFGSVVASLH